MQFGLNEEQRMFRDAASRWLANSYGDAARARAEAAPGGIAPAFWSELGAMGWLGAGFPEDFGGSDGGATETAILLEEAGRVLMVEPLVELGVLLPHLMAAIAPIALPDLFAGALVATPAWAEPGGRDPFDPACTLRAGRLEGSKVQVAATDAAGVLLVHARDTDGAPVIARLTIDGEGVAIAPRRQLDGRIVSTVTFTAAPAEVLARGEAARLAFANAFDHALVAVCAEALGIAAGLSARTLDYARTRTQFGKTISGFQVIQHRLADLHIALEEARSLTVMACKMLEGAPGSTRAAALSSAKAGVVARCLVIAREAIQLHGGVGMTEELPVGRGFRRLHALNVLYGDEAWHLARIRP